MTTLNLKGAQEYFMVCTGFLLQVGSHPVYAHMYCHLHPHKTIPVFPLLCEVVEVAAQSIYLTFQHFFRTLRLYASCSFPRGRRRRWFQIEFFCDVQCKMDDNCAALF